MMLFRTYLRRRIAAVLHRDGTGEPGARIDVTDKTGKTVCSATVQADGKWSCKPTRPLQFTENVVTPHQSVNDYTGTGNPHTFSFPGGGGGGGGSLSSPPSSPVITGPAHGSTTSNSRPKITGTGVAGAKIEVYDEHGRLVCTAVVAADPSWSCTPARPLPAGKVTLTARQTVHGGTVTTSAKNSFTVLAHPGRSGSRGAAIGTGFGGMAAEVARNRP